MTTKLLIGRELLERIDESAICDGTDATISDDLFTQLVGALDAPVQGEAVEGIVPKWRYDALVQHCKLQDKNIAKLSDERNTAWMYEQREVWFWQGDGEDYPESLSCPVVIKADDLRAILAPRQPDGDNSDFPNLRDGLEVVGWYHSHAEVATSEKARVVQWLPDCVEPLCRLSDAQRAIAELRDRLDVMTQCADNYSRMFEESEEECERLRVKLMTIASAEPGRHNIEWAKAMAATGNNEAYAKWREAFDQRDKLAEILRDIVPGCKWKHMRPRIDAALAEIDHDNE